MYASAQLTKLNPLAASIIIHSLGEANRLFDFLARAPRSDCAEATPMFALEARAACNAFFTSLNLPDHRDRDNVTFVH
jgi:hypothetical protein